MGHGQQHRAVALRRGHGVPHGRLPPGEQPRSVRLQDDRLRQDVEGDRERHPEEHAELRALRSARIPVRRGLLYLGTENGIYVSFDDGENWQPLQNNLPHAPVYWHRGAGALQRPGDRDLRPRLLDPGRHHAAAAADAAGARRPTRTCSRRGRRTGSATSPAPSTPYDDPTVGREPAVRRGDQLLPEVRAGGKRHAVPSSIGKGQDGPHAARAEGGRPQPRLLGSALGADARQCGCGRARCTRPDVRRRPAGLAAGRRAADDPAAARDLHGEALGRRTRAVAAAHRSGRIRTRAAPRPTSSSR